MINPICGNPTREELRQQHVEILEMFEGYTGIPMPWAKANVDHTSDIAISWKREGPITLTFGDVTMHYNHSGLLYKTTCEDYHSGICMHDTNSIDKPLATIISFEDIEKTEPQFDGLNDFGMNAMTNEMAKRLREQMDENIKKALSDAGYSFTSEEHLTHFLKTRCELISFHDSNRKCLTVDGKPVMEWDETINIDFNGTTVTATIG